MHVAEPVQDIVPTPEAASAEDTGARHSGVFPKAKPRLIKPRPRGMKFEPEPEYPELVNDRNVQYMIARAEHRENVSSEKRWMKNNRNR